jgi:hypothetical protein
MQMKSESLEERGEIRCYGNPRVINGFAGVMAIYPVVAIFVSVLNGRVFLVSWLPFVFLIGIFQLWYASLHGTFIGVDLDSELLIASNWFIRTKPVPIGSITRLGTRGMFAGAATEVEITYRKPSGREKTVGYGTTTFLNPKELRRVLDALVKINPSVHIPHELVEKLPHHTS